MLLSCVCPRGGSLFFSPLILSSIIPHTRPLSTEAKGGERGESEREGEEDESQGLKMKMMGDEMREMEVKFRRYLKPDQGFIVRLDGCSFSKFTRDFEKVFVLFCFVSFLFFSFLFFSFLFSIFFLLFPFPFPFPFPFLLFPPPSNFPQAL